MENIAFVEPVFRGLLTLCGCRQYQQKDENSVDQFHKRRKYVKDICLSELKIENGRKMC